MHGNILASLFYLINVQQNAHRTEDLKLFAVVKHICRQDNNRISYLHLSMPLRYTAAIRNNLQN